ncbi:MAG: epimerase [Burkholderiales bacterium]|nr:epimerase [Burkholderiales bacterium]
MRILILGGTGLTGPHQVRYAAARGHQVTVFNRGRTQPVDWPAGVEHLTGDRLTGQLDALRGRDWDVCIDNPTTLPSWVRDAGQVLAGHVSHYIFISTISVYANLEQPPNESSRLASYGGPDVYAETMDTLRASGMQLYGPLKVACEQEARRQFGDATTIIRPGLIVGTGDQTDRFTYWPLRLARGGEVLAPGTPDDPVQVIDAHDLAEWTIRVAEQRITGTFNATGPAKTLRFGDMLRAIDPAAQLTWVPADFLAQQGVKPWSDMPAWVPPQGEMGGMMRADVSRAVAAGLTFRPIAQTARDALDWFRSQPAERQAQPRAGLSAAREAEVLQAWRVRP